MGKLAPRLPDVAFAEVRYRIKSWNRMEMCIEDTLAAVEAVARAGSERCILLGFSMGGAVAIGASRHASVSEMIGLAPWIPDRLDLSGLDGKRLTVFHGALDRYLPGIPGVSPANSRRGFERAQALGVEGSYSMIPGALHGIALRAHWGRPIPLPRASRWADLVAAELERARTATQAAAAALCFGGRRLAVARLGDAPALELVARRPPHVPHEPEPLEPADHPPRDVDLPAVEAVAGRARKRMVVVVPALAEDEQSDEPVVPRLVPRAVVLAPEHVADRVHRERRVLVEEDPEQATPDHRLDTLRHGAAEPGSRSGTGSRG